MGTANFSAPLANSQGFLSPQALIAAAMQGMAVSDEGHEAYLGAVLTAIGGWGAWCAYKR